jgi:hypothetical protein
MSGVMFAVPARRSKKVDMKTAIFFFIVSLTWLCSFSTAIHTIKGRVTDQTGEAIADVRVRIKGEATTTRTDTNGNYVLEASGVNVVLIFTSDLYETKETYAGNDAIVNVQLKQRLQ